MVSAQKTVLLLLQYGSAISFVLSQKNDSCIILIKKEDAG